MANLYGKAKNPSAAMKVIETILMEDSTLVQKEKKKTLDRLTALGIPQLPGKAALHFRAAQFAEEAQDWPSAVHHLKAATDLKEGKSNRYRYSYARALRKLGEPRKLAEAEKVLTEVASSKEDDFWKKLSVETLERLKTVKP